MKSGEEIAAMVSMPTSVPNNTPMWKRGDGTVIDGGINGLAMGIIPWFTRLAGRAQSGYIFHYAFAMVIGIVILVSWMTIAGN